MPNDETVATVDAQDNPIGQKLRSELTNTDCWRMVSVWIENDQGQVLLQQRSQGKKHSPGSWTPAAEGTVALGDDYQTTAYRELEEEIGLTGHELTPTNKVHAKFESGERQCQGYRTICNWPIEQFAIQLEEVERIEWVDKGRVIDEIMGKAPHTRKWPKSIKYWPDVFGLV